MKLIQWLCLCLIGAVSPLIVVGQTCEPSSDAYHFIDFQTDASGNILPRGTVIDENTFADWGVHFTPANSNYPLVLFDSANPTGGDQDLGAPSNNCPSCTQTCPGESNNGGGLNNCSPLGMIMIIEENWSDSNNDGLEDNPDDLGSGGSFSMDIDGKVNINKISFVDDVTATVKFYYADGLNATEIFNGGLDNDTSVFIINKTDVTSVDFSFATSGAVSEIEFCSNGSIGDYIWLDENANGVQDPLEIGLNGVVVSLYSSNGEFLRSTTTTNHPQNGNLGYYIFEEVDFGSYYIQVEDQTGLAFTNANMTNDDDDSDIDDSNGPNTSHTFDLNHGDHVENIDIGFTCLLTTTIQQVCDYNGMGVSCAGASDGCIKATPANGGGNYQYYWSNGQRTQQINNLAVGTYSVTVEDANGCTVVTSFEVVGPGPLSVSIEGQDLSCYNSGDGTSTVNPSGGTEPYTYAWNDENSQTTQTATALSAGNYTVTVVDANDCSAVTQITLSQPSELLASTVVSSSYHEGVDISTFNGSDGELTVTAQGGAGNYSYQWSDSQNQTASIATGLIAGSYTVTVTDAEGCSVIATADLINPSKLGDFIWVDFDADGVQDNGELGIENVNITLTGLADNGTNVSRSTISGSDGDYNFDGLLPGDYHIVISYPGSYYVTDKDMAETNTIDSDINTETNESESINLTQGQYYQDLDGGLFEMVAIGDFIWEDLNADGFQANNESGINGVTVNLYNEIGDLLESTLTQYDVSSDRDGFYEFAGLMPGRYYIEVVAPEGFGFSPPNNQGDDQRDSDVDSENGPGTSSTRLVGSGQNRIEIDGGLFEYASIGNFVWIDQDEDGEQEVAEVIDGMNGVLIELYNDSEELLDSTRTTINDIVGDLHEGENGYYLFDSLTPGNYYLKIESPEGYNFTAPNAGNNDDTDSDVDHSNGLNTTTIFNINAGEQELSIDAGITSASVPVTFVAFDAKIKKGNVAYLQWVTGSELNNKEFIVERKYESEKSFASIGVVDGQGTSFVNNYYFFEDKLFRSGTYYYRLKQLDHNGIFSYSNVVAVEMNQELVPALNLYPNPTTDFITIKLDGENVDVNILVYDSKGTLVIEKRGETFTNDYFMRIDSLNDGVYYVLVETQGLVFRQKLVKVK